MPPKDGLDVDAQIFQKKVKDFEKEFEVLQDRYGVAVVAAISSINVPGIPNTSLGFATKIIYVDKRKMDATIGQKPKEGAIPGIQAKPTVDKD